MTPFVAAQLVISVLAGVTIAASVKTKHRIDRYAIGILVAALCFIAFNAVTIVEFLSK